MVAMLGRAKALAGESLKAPFRRGSAEDVHRAFQGRGKFLGSASTAPPDHEEKTR
jgi:hypothetical protein